MSKYYKVFTTNGYRVIFEEFPDGSFRSKHSDFEWGPTYIGWGNLRSYMSFTKMYNAKAEELDKYEITKEQAFIELL